MRLTALITPTARLGRGDSKARPTATAHCPTRTWPLGIHCGTTSGRGGSIFNNTNMRLWSVATSRAGLRAPSASWTKIESGLLAKLNALETM